MERSSSRLRSLADDLLLLTRMETAAHPRSRSRVALGPLLAEVVEDVGLSSRGDTPRVVLTAHDPDADAVVRGPRGAVPARWATSWATR